MTPAGRRRRVACAALTVAAGVRLLAGGPPGEPQPAAPRRIVSVVPAVTEILFAVGAASRVVGVGSFARVPAGLARLPRVGGLIDPDIETILALRPDLVVAYETQVDLLEQLARARIPVFRYAHGNLTDVLDTIRAIGDRTGTSTRAARLAGRIESDLDAIRERVRGLERPRTLLVFARETYSLRNLFASGGTGFLHDMLDAAGGVNVFAGIARASVQATTETILAMAPDVVLEVREDGDRSEARIARELHVWNALGALPAVRNGRVHFLVGRDLVVPGPHVAEATARLARVLHPDAFARGLPIR